MPSAPPLSRPLFHPLHGLLLAWPVALFPAALMSDITYLNTAEMQWSNFSAWLITGALLFGGMALLIAMVGLVRERRPRTKRHRLIYVILLALAWLAGLVNAFQHSHDAWSSVGTTGIILSVLSTVLAMTAGWVAYAGYRENGL